ncbi:MAG: hypothetical protein IT210_09110 [Armatimonadetes bacterium]|nr:hypothetical protein [Armatimonadota bacterium]
MPLKENWNDALLLNYSTEPFRCPALPGQRYACGYNAYLSGKPYSKIASPA